MATNEKYKIEVTIEGKDSLSPTLDKTAKGIKDVGDKADDTKKKATGLSSAFGQMNGVLGQLGIGLSIAGFIGASQQLNQLGTEVNAVSHTFEQVSGGTDSASASLSRLRQITGGVIDDMTLMKGANSLLITGIADTNEQAAQLVNLGSRLGAALGRDAAESVENLNAALLNNSFLRLDTLGISASAVRERVNELKEAGLDMSAAFSQAVVEIGTQTLEDLGSAASVGETAIARLTTNLQNMGQSLAQTVNTNLEIAANTLEQIIVLSDIALGGTGGNDTLEQRNQILGRANTILEAQIANERELATVRDEAAKVALAIAQDPSFAAGLTSGQSLTSALSDDGSQFGSSFGASTSSANRGAALDVLSTLGYNVETLSDESILEIARNVDMVLGAVGQSQAELEAQTRASNVELINQERAFGIVSQGGVLATKALDGVTVGISGIERQFSNLSESFSGGLVGRGASTFFDPDALQDVTTQASALMDEYERLKELGESSEFTLVSEEEVARARDIANEAKNFANEAQRGATAFANASLSQLSGQTGGGALGELGDLVLAGIEDEDLRTQTQQSLDFASGRQTDLSVAIRDDLAPTIAAIANEYGPEAAAQAAERATQAIQDGVIDGLSDSDIAQRAQEAIGFNLGGGGGQQVTVQAGDTLSGISAQTGISLADLIAANGGSTFIQAGQVLSVGDGTSLIPIEGTVGDITTAFDNILGFATGLVPDSAQGGIAGIVGGISGVLGGAGNFLGIAPSQGNLQGAAPDGPLNQQESQLSAAADQSQSILETIAQIEATDLSTVADPLATDTKNIRDDVDLIVAGLESLNNTDFRLNVPMTVYIDFTNSDELARNPAFVAAVTAVNINNGGTSPGTGGGR